MLRLVACHHSPPRWQPRPRGQPLRLPAPQPSLLGQRVHVGEHDLLHLPLRTLSRRRCRADPPASERVHTTPPPFGLSRRTGSTSISRSEDGREALGVLSIREVVRVEAVRFLEEGGSRYRKSLAGNLAWCCNCRIRASPSDHDIDQTNATRSLSFAACRFGEPASRVGTGRPRRTRTSEPTHRWDLRQARLCLKSSCG